VGGGENFDWVNREKEKTENGQKKHEKWNGLLGDLWGKVQKGGEGKYLRLRKAGKAGGWGRLEMDTEGSGDQSDWVGI